MHQLAYRRLHILFLFSTWLLFSKGERCHCFLHIREDEMNDSHTSSAASELCETSSCKHLLNILLFRVNIQIESLLIWCVSYSVELWDWNTGVFLTNRAQKQSGIENYWVISQKYSQFYRKRTEFWNDTNMSGFLKGHGVCLHMHELLFKLTWHTQHEHTCIQMTHLTGMRLNSWQYVDIFWEVWYSQT